MAWYRTGTVNATNGSTALTGVGTRWASNARVGDAIRLPDGQWYEVINIASETTMGIVPAYQGTTVAASPLYAIAPMQGYVKESADRLRKITDGLADITADVEAARAAADAAKLSETNSKASETAANASKVAAAASQTAAKTSETNSKTSETNSKASETAAASSRDSASASATSATASANSATASAAAALASQNAAKTSETNSKTSETNSKTSETNAKASETAANTSKTAAAASQTAAAASQTASKTSETNAASSATQAAGQATLAANSRTAALASENKAKAWADNPEDTTVETGKYSALHWAAKAKASADAAGAAIGTRLNSIATAVMAVNDMLIADTTTTMVKIATGAMGRTLLGTADAAAARTAVGLNGAAVVGLNALAMTAGNVPYMASGTGWSSGASTAYGRSLWNTADAAGARSLLALGDAALGTQTTSISDTVLGRALKNGDHGIGTPLSNLTQLVSTEVDNVLNTGVIYVNASGGIGGLPSQLNGYLQTVVYDTTFRMQTFTAVSSGLQWFRNRVTAGWNPWQVVVTPTTLAEQAHALGLTAPFMPNTATTDFNTVISPGWHDRLLSGTNTNGPGASTTTVAGGSSFWYVFVAQYGASPNDQILQMGFPYGAGASTGRIIWRNRYQGVWTAWSGTMKLGDFSIGANSVLETTATAWQGNKFTGWSSNSPDSPGGGNAVGIDMGYATNRRMQIGITTVGDLWSRYTDDATGQKNWARHVTSQNLVGTVQAPNSSYGTIGAVIERGSTANGEYTKYADGTMECWAVRRCAYASTAILTNSWTFPAAFSSNPVVVGTPFQGTLSNISPLDFRDMGSTMVASVTASSCAPRIHLTTGATGSFTSPNFMDVYCIAKGRWRA